MCLLFQTTIFHDILDIIYVRPVRTNIILWASSFPDKSSVECRRRQQGYGDYDLIPIYSNQRIV